MLATHAHMPLYMNINDIGVKNGDEWKKQCATKLIMKSSGRLNLLKKIQVKHQ